MPQEKVRVYALARELHMESKDLLDLCHKAGFDVKNQLSGLDPEQRVLVEQMVKKQHGGAPSVSAPKGATVQLPSVNKVIRILDAPRQRPGEGARIGSAPTTGPAQVEVPEDPVPQAPPAADTGADEAPVPQPPTEAAPPGAPQAPAAIAPLAAAATPAPEAEQPVAPPPPVATPTQPATPLAPAAQSTPSTDPNAGRVRSLPHSRPGGRVRELGGTPRAGDGPRRPQPPLTRTGAGFVAPPKPRLPIDSKAKKPSEPPVLKPLIPLSKEQMADSQRRPLTPEMLIRDQEAKKAGPPVPGAVPVAEDEELDEAGKKKAGAGKTKGPGHVGDRTQRRKDREKRAQDRKGAGAVVVNEGGQVVVLEPEERHRRGSSRRLQDRIRKPQGTQPRKGGKVAIQLPLTVRALCEAIGLKQGPLLMKLLNRGVDNPTINSSLEADLAEEIALEAGFELDIKYGADPEEDLLHAYEEPDNPEDLVPRAPVVTIMGHVDHGKTSLLDKIRQSNVAATEAGGITQVIRAWRVEHNGRPITFLDTPGHEAFTKMRARGAQVTDIAVIVVAADDGVMPQTEEAINHARAAKVSLVVAINKVDMPSANLNRTRQQLYGLNVLPDNMGGDTPFVETSAVTGKGIDELLESISLVAELKELHANPNKPSRGTCLEAMLSEGEGVRATLLVQQGTLHRGDVILCGAAYGRVRQMYDDLGRPIQDAGPSVPVRITGLDEVPNADDPFIVVPDLATAREIAETRKSRQQEAALVKRMPVTLERLTEAKIVELKVILKADFRGSIEAIRKELEKLHHEEVRVRVLHAAIGAITESDVQLALTSPEDTLIVGFNAVPDDRAMSLAEEKGIKIQQYNIIYNLTNDIRAALEGKLKPREEVIHLGRALVRETFKISRVGTIAGCYVTQGTIKRSGKIRVIREGVVIYPPPDRSASLESLKRFKDDASEVREGFECGMKVAGYDDIKVGDVIESYRVEEVQRTLDS